MPIDVNRVAAAAFDALLDEGERSGDRQGAESRRRFGGVGALVVGVGLGVAARALYRRARSIDLEQTAASLEDKLKR
jgi:hypothetical protein